MKSLRVPLYMLRISHLVHKIKHITYTAFLYLISYLLDVGMHIIVRPLVSEQAGSNHIVCIARKRRV